MLKPTELKAVRRYLSDLDKVKMTKPYSKTLLVFDIDDIPFAYLETGKQLLQLSLRSDPELSKLLRERYEEVLPGHKLDPRHWNTIVVSGQLSFGELTALIDHSYQLAIAESSHRKS